jgi:hypothetical protein
MTDQIEYTVHFQKGTRVGARSLRMVQVEAETPAAARAAAKREFNEPGYRVTRIDHFDGYHIVIDY